MKKLGASLLAVLLVTGFAVAAHKGETHAGDSGTGAVSDTPNAGKTAGPENTGKPEDAGPENRSKGIQQAITNVPDQVADAVLKPIQNLEPGKALGNALKGIGELLQLQNPDTNQTSTNSTENSS